MAQSSALAAASSTTPYASINGGTFGSGADTLVLTLAESGSGVGARASITIDGQTLSGSPISVTAAKSLGQYETFTFKGTFGPNAHNLGITFLNGADAASASGPDLYVNGISYDGLQAQPSAATLDTVGTTNFTIPPANDAEATPTTINGGTFGSGPDTLVVTLAEDAYKGNAQANIAIDGKTLNATPLTVTALQSAGQTETFTFKGTFGPNAHDLAISFLNDAYAGTPATDRNLYLDNATYDGVASRPSSASLFSGGTSHYTIPPAGDPETSVALAKAM